MKFESLLFSRGIPFSELDLPGRLGLFLTNTYPSERPSAATWLILNPLVSEGYLLAPGASVSKFDLKSVGNSDLLQVPMTWTKKLGLPRVVCWKADGVLESEDAERLICEEFRGEGVLLIGGTIWTESAFSASPMGERLGKNSWSTFAPAGRGIAIEVPLMGCVEGSALSDGADPSLDILTSLFKDRFPKPVVAAVFCGCERIEEAMALFVMRRAWGELPPVVIPRESHPGWKRLLQNLGIQPEKSDAAPISLETFLSHMPKALMRNLRPHLEKSRIIPEDLLEAIS